MPKGQKAREYPPPVMVHCDFCGDAFKPFAWDQRTCHRCAAKGAPDQSKSEWAKYSSDVTKFMRAIGRKPPLKIGLLAKAAGLRRRPGFARV